MEGKGEGRAAFVLYVSRGTGNAHLARDTGRGYLAQNQVKGIPHLRAKYHPLQMRQSELWLAA